MADLAEGSDLIILPTTPNPLDLDTTIKAAELLEPLAANYKVLLTKVDSRTTNGRDARKFLEEAKLPLFRVDIPLLVAFQRSPGKGVIVKDYPDPRSHIGWSRYQSVGRGIMP